MYEIFLFIHSWLRWIVLILGLLVIIKSFFGWQGKKTYGKADNALSGSFIGILHLQLLIGLVLYFFLSPITTSAFQDFGGAMKAASLRYWAVEHIFVMILAVVIAQIGRTRSKKASGNVKKFKSVTIFYLIAMILMLSRIPFGEVGRLFRN
ncbi:hypothetical protein QQ020_19470 [Fulvivirgaceae bacterium BMA12]|uniref:Cytochrome B n=1 Tax=Agaribacillus aureus TaxID=3051825 RepID=A0ABT8L929_9BACT|nr:hypothetical protein [Fulvivirgaceae bacterium BMA12]